MGNGISENVIYFCYYKTKSLGNNHVRVFLPRRQTCTFWTLKWFRFMIANHVLRHMCNLHIKETEISQKRSNGIKNWKITYSVILSVLSNKTNLILGFSALLKDAQMASNPCQTRQQTCFSFFMPQDPSINHLNFYCIKQIDYIFPCVSVCVL